MIRFYAHKMLQTTEGKNPLEVSFHAEKGQFLSLYGNSGAGKTTVLRILAGLTQTQKSRIVVKDEVWDDSEKKVHLPTQKRSIGFVFQDFALFPNLTVRENLEFALQKGEDKKIVDELLEMVELQSLQKSKPQNLSGGQKQRVALARAIVRRPEILLLDEPLSALDDEMRCKLQDHILKVHKHYQLTTILVSHHLPELFKLSDKVIILDKGKIVNEGKPEILFSKQNIGSEVILTGEIIEIKKNDSTYIIKVLSGNNNVKTIVTEADIKELKTGQKVVVTFRAIHPQIQVIS